MKNEMWSHENSTMEYRQGYRDGLIAARDVCQEYVDAVRNDSRVNESAWIEITVEHIDDELSMYEVGDEE